VDKLSGKEGVRRPQFEKLLGDARMKKFDIVLVWKLDRFGRSNLTPSALARNCPLCCALHNGSYVEHRIMLSSRGEPAQSRRFVVNCST
jgi:hypothetical protein